MYLGFSLVDERRPTSISYKLDLNIDTEAVTSKDKMYTDFKSSPGKYSLMQSGRFP
jgi:hypothetical protein